MSSFPYPTTEFAALVLKSDVDLSSNTTWAAIQRTIARQPGFQRQSYGRQLESPDIVILLVDWDTLKSHQDFIASPEYIPFTAQARHLFSSISFFHFLPTSALHHALPRATVTEVARFFNTSASFSARVQEFADRVEKGRPEGWKGIAHGVTVEDMARLVTRGGEEEENDGELELGGRGKKGHVLLIGWQSKEAHLRFKETALFKNIVGLLEKGNSGVELYHVEFMRFDGQEAFLG